MRRITKIIIHCSATAEGKNFTVKNIDTWHRQKGWDGCGYHYVIHLDGSVHTGRPLAKAGAHCVGQNKNSIGICYIGGLAKDGKTAKDTRTEAQRAALKALVSKLLKEFPGATVHGHNEFAAKACPSFEVRKEVWS